MSDRRPPNGRRFGGWCLAAAVLLAAGLAPATASAWIFDKQCAPKSSIGELDKVNAPNALIMLDRSGSMSQQGGGGLVRWQAAKRAIDALGNSMVRSGTCTQNNFRGCDRIRLGLGLFWDGKRTVTCQVRYRVPRKKKVKVDKKVKYKKKKKVHEVSKSKPHKKKGQTSSFTFKHFPKNYNDEIKVKVEVWGDFGDQNEWADVYVDGNKEGRIDGGQLDCNSNPYAKTVKVPASVLSDGKIDVRVENSKNTSPALSCPRSEVEATVSFWKWVVKRHKKYWKTHKLSESYDFKTKGEDKTFRFGQFTSFNGRLRVRVGLWGNYGHRVEFADVSADGNALGRHHGPGDCQGPAWKRWDVSNQTIQDGSLNIEVANSKAVEPTCGTNRAEVEVSFWERTRKRYKLYHKYYTTHAESQNGYVTGTEKRFSFRKYRKNNFGEVTVNKTRTAAGKVDRQSRVDFTDAGQTKTIPFHALAQNPDGDVKVDVELRGDYNQPDEFAKIWIDGNAQGKFQGPNTDCTKWGKTTYTVPGSTVKDGKLKVKIQTNSEVGTRCTTNAARARVRYKKAGKRTKVTKSEKVRLEVTVQGGDFDAQNEFATVYVDGNKVGTHPGPSKNCNRSSSATETFVVSGKVIRDKKMAVRVKKSSNVGSCFRGKAATEVRASYWTKRRERFRQYYHVWKFARRRKRIKNTFKAHAQTKSDQFEKKGQDKTFHFGRYIPNNYGQQSVGYGSKTQGNTITRSQIVDFPSTPAGSRFKTKSLNYTWFDASVRLGRKGHPTSQSEMDALFNPNSSGVGAGGTGEHSAQVHWHTGMWGAKPGYLPSDGYAWMAAGYLFAPTTGQYEIGLDSDDAGDLFVGGDRVASWYGGHSAGGRASTYDNHSSAVFLRKGWHRIRARVEDDGGGDGLSVAWKTPGNNSWTSIPRNRFSRQKPDSAQAVFRDLSKAGTKVSVDVRLRGDYGEKGEFADIYIDGNKVGRHAGAARDCNSSIQTFTVDKSKVADGRLVVRAENSPQVAGVCADNDLRASIRYDRPDIPPSKTTKIEKLKVGVELWGDYSGANQFAKIYADNQLIGTFQGPKNCSTPKKKTFEAPGKLIQDGKVAVRVENSPAVGLCGKHRAVVSMGLWKKIIHEFPKTWQATKTVHERTRYKQHVGTKAGERDRVTVLDVEGSDGHQSFRDKVVREAEYGIHWDDQNSHFRWAEAKNDGHFRYSARIPAGTQKLVGRLKFAGSSYNGSGAAFWAEDVNGKKYMIACDAGFEKLSIRCQNNQGDNFTFDKNFTISAKADLRRFYVATDVDNVPGTFKDEARLFRLKVDAVTDLRLNDQMVGRWNFEGDYKDETPYGNDGTRQGNANIVWKARAGTRSVRFGGGGSVTMNSPKQVHKTDRITVAGWVKTGGDGMIVGKSDSYFLWFSNGHLRWEIHDGNKWIDAHGEGGRHLTGLDDGKWHHVAAIYDGTRFETWVDGKLKRTYRRPNMSINNSGKKLGVGNAPGWNRHLTGHVDDVRLYDRALTRAEIADLARGSRDRHAVSKVEQFRKAGQETTIGFNRYLKNRFGSQKTKRGQKTAGAVVTDSSSRVFFQPDQTFYIRWRSAYRNSKGPVEMELHLTGDYAGNAESAVVWADGTKLGTHPGTNSDCGTGSKTFQIPKRHLRDGKIDVKIDNSAQVNPICQTNRAKADFRFQRPDLPGKKTTITEKLKVEVDLWGDYDANNEYAKVWIDGNFQGKHSGPSGCGQRASKTFIVPGRLLRDGTVDVRVKNSGAVGASCHKNGDRDQVRVDLRLWEKHRIKYKDFYHVTRRKRYRKRYRNFRTVHKETKREQFRRRGQSQTILFPKYSKNSYGRIDKHPGKTHQAPQQTRSQVLPIRRKRSGKIENDYRFTFDDTEDSGSAGTVEIRLRGDYGASNEWAQVWVENRYRGKMQGPKDCRSGTQKFRVRESEIDDGTVKVRVHTADAVGERCNPDDIRAKLLYRPPSATEKVTEKEKVRLKVDLRGDYNGGNEYAGIYADGDYVGRHDGGKGCAGTATETFHVSGKKMRDGKLKVRVDNSHAVSICGGGRDQATVHASFWNKRITIYPKDDKSYVKTKYKRKIRKTFKPTGGNSRIWLDSFEDGNANDEGWYDTDDWYDDGWPEYKGQYSARVDDHRYCYSYWWYTYCYGGAGHFEVKARNEPKTMSGGRKVTRVQFYYWERSNNNGGGVRLRDSQDRIIAAVGTDNPQWTVWDRGGKHHVGNGSNRNWQRVRLKFDWSAHKFWYQFKDVSRGRKTSGWSQMQQNADDLEQIEIVNFGGDSFRMNFDEFSAKAPAQWDRDWADSFEDGNARDDGWRRNDDWYDDSWPDYRGTYSARVDDERYCYGWWWYTYCYGGANDYEVKAYALPDELKGGRKAKKLTFYYWETSNNEDGGVRLRSSNGRTIAWLGSENPGWMIHDGGGWRGVGRGDYRDWQRVTVEFDWKQHRFRYEFEDTDSGRISSDWRPMVQNADNLERIEIQNRNQDSFQMNFDAFEVDAPPVQYKKWVEGFEDGDAHDDEWRRTRDWSADGWPDHGGNYSARVNDTRRCYSYWWYTYCYGGAGNYEVKAWNEPYVLYGGKKAQKVTFYYWEDGTNDDGGIRLRSARNKLIAWVGTDNPGWRIQHGGGWENVGRGDYRDWQKVELRFDWTRHRYRYEFTDTGSGRTASGWRSMIQNAESLERVEVVNGRGNDFQMWFDDFEAVVPQSAGLKRSEEFRKRGVDKPFEFDRFVKNNYGVKKVTSGQSGTGNRITDSSEKTFSTRDETFTVKFDQPVTTARAKITVDVTLHGDYAGSAESAEIQIDGTNVGTHDGPSQDCGSATKTFRVAGSKIADGKLNVTVDNSAQVSPICKENKAAVRYEFRKPNPPGPKKTIAELIRADVTLWGKYRGNSRFADVYAEGNYLGRHQGPSGRGSATKTFYTSGKGIRDGNFRVRVNNSNNVPGQWAGRSKMRVTLSFWKKKKIQKKQFYHVTKRKRYQKKYKDHYTTHAEKKYERALRRGSTRTLTFDQFADKNYGGSSSHNGPTHAGSSITRSMIRGFDSRGGERAMTFNRTQDSSTRVKVRVRLKGDYNLAGEYADVSVDGKRVGQHPGPSDDCKSSWKAFYVPAARVNDGTLKVKVDNSGKVSPICEKNEAEARLEYTSPSATEIITNTEKIKVDVELAGDYKSGTEYATVYADNNKLGTHQGPTSDCGGSKSKTFTTSGKHIRDGRLDIEIDDQWAVHNCGGGKDWARVTVEFWRERDRYYPKHYTQWKKVDYQKRYRETYSPRQNPIKTVWQDGFEDGNADNDGWRDDDWYADGWPDYRGTYSARVDDNRYCYGWWWYTYCYGGAGNYEVKAWIEPSSLKGGREATQFTFYYWEQGHNSDGGVRLRDDNGQIITWIGTENPGWTYQDDNGWHTAGSGDYRDWQRVRVEFDWKNHRFRYEFTDMNSGRSSSSWRPMVHNADNLERIEVLNRNSRDFRMNFDEFSVRAPKNPVGHWSDGFEDGNARNDGWNKNNDWRADGWPDHRGTYSARVNDTEYCYGWWWYRYCYGGAGNYEVKAWNIPRALAGGRKATSFSFHYWEDGTNSDGGIRLRDAQGRRITWIGTESPEWYVRHDHGWDHPGDGDYRDWQRVTVRFDWQNHRFRYEFTDTDSGRSAGRWRDMVQNARNLAKIEVINRNSDDFQLWYDDFRVSLPPSGAFAREEQIYQSGRNAHIEFEQFVKSNFGSTSRSKAGTRKGRKITDSDTKPFSKRDETVTIKFDQPVQNVATDVTVDVRLHGDYGNNAEYADITIDGRNVGRHQGPSGDCNSDWKTFTVPASTIASDGKLNVVVDNSARVAPICPTNEVEATYQFRKKDRIAKRIRRTETITAEVRLWGDYDARNEYAHIRMDGNFVGTHQGPNQNCTGPAVKKVDLDGKKVLTDGNLDVSIDTTGAVSGNCHRRGSLDKAQVSLSFWNKKRVKYREAYHVWKKKRYQKKYKTRYKTHDETQRERFHRRGQNKTLVFNQFEDKNYGGLKKYTGKTKTHKPISRKLDVGFNESGGKKTATFENTQKAENKVKVKVRLRGDYGSGDEYAQIYADGNRIGRHQGPGNDCAEDWATFTASRSSVADGKLNIRIDNSEEVGIICSKNEGRVELKYRPPDAQVKYRETEFVRVKVDLKGDYASGNEYATVWADGNKLGYHQGPANDCNGSKVETFQADGKLIRDGRLDVKIDNQWAVHNCGGGDDWAEVTLEFWNRKRKSTPISYDKWVKVDYRKRYKKTVRPQARHKTRGWSDGFEDGNADDDGWRDDDWYSDGWPDFRGSYSARVDDERYCYGWWWYRYCYGGAGHFEVKAWIEPKVLRQTSGKAKQFTYYYWESGTNNGGGVRLRDSNGRKIGIFGTNNPQWRFWDRHGRQHPGNGDYRDWIRVRVKFDWRNHRFWYQFREMDSGHSASGWRPMMDNAKNLERIEVLNFGGNDFEMNFDEFSVQVPIPNARVEQFDSRGDTAHITFDRFINNNFGNRRVKKWNVVSGKTVKDSYTRPFDRSGETQYVKFRTPHQKSRTRIRVQVRLEGDFGAGDEYANIRIDGHNKGRHNGPNDCGSDWQTYYVPAGEISDGKLNVRVDHSGEVDPICRSNQIEARMRFQKPDTPPDKLIEDEVVRAETALWGDYSWGGEYADVYADGRYQGRHQGPNRDCTGPDVQRFHVRGRKIRDGKLRFKIDNSGYVGICGNDRDKARVALSFWKQKKKKWKDFYNVWRTKRYRENYKDNYTTRGDQKSEEFNRSGANKLLHFDQYNGTTGANVIKVKVGLRGDYAWGGEYGDVYLDGNRLGRHQGPGDCNGFDWKTWEVGTNYLNDDRLRVRVDNDWSVGGWCNNSEIRVKFEFWKDVSWKDGFDDGDAEDDGWHGGGDWHASGRDYNSRYSGRVKDVRTCRQTCNRHCNTYCDGWCWSCWRGTYCCDYDTHCWTSCRTTCSGGAGDHEVKSWIEPNELSGGEKIQLFEFYFWEDGTNSDGGVELKDANGETVTWVGSDNPQWLVKDDHGYPDQVGSGDYNDWTRVRLKFDWGSHRVHYEFENMEGHEYASGWKSMVDSADGVERIEITNLNQTDIEMWFDEFRAEVNTEKKAKKWRWRTRWDSKNVRVRKYRWKTKNWFDERKSPDKWKWATKNAEKWVKHRKWRWKHAVSKNEQKVQKFRWAFKWATTRQKVRKWRWKERSSRNRANAPDMWRWKTKQDQKWVKYHRWNWDHEYSWHEKKARKFRWAYRWENTTQRVRKWRWKTQKSFSKKKPPRKWRWRIKPDDKWIAHHNWKWDRSVAYDRRNLKKWKWAYKWKKKDVDVRKYNWKYRNEWHERQLPRWEWAYDWATKTTQVRKWKWARNVNWDKQRLRRWKWAYKWVKDRVKVRKWRWDYRTSWLSDQVPKWKWAPKSKVKTTKNRKWKWAWKWVWNQRKGEMWKWIVSRVLTPRKVEKWNWATKTVTKTITKTVYDWKTKQGTCTQVGDHAFVSDKVQEDNHQNMMQTLNSQSPGGNRKSPIGAAASTLKNAGSMNTAKRRSFGVLITDGVVEEPQADDAIRNLCQARDRKKSPTDTYVVGFVNQSNPEFNDLLAAAGGTGTCCPAGQPNCKPKAQIDPCSLSKADQQKWAKRALGGGQPLACSGSYKANHPSKLKNALLNIAEDVSCSFELKFPSGKPYTPEKAHTDPSSVKVTVEHKTFGTITVPHKSKGLAQELISQGVPRRTALQYRNEGWEFKNKAKRQKIVFTSQLCGDIMSGNARKVTTQLACDCPKADAGASCKVSGRSGICASGQSICNIPPGLDGCQPKYSKNQKLGTKCEVPGEQGRCKVGVKKCANGKPQCEQVHQPVPEICNGLDDDCDGTVDNIVESWDTGDPTTGKDWKLKKSGKTRRKLSCGYTSSCKCERNVDNEHKGDAQTLRKEYEEMLKKTNNQKRSCWCVE